VDASVSFSKNLPFVLVSSVSVTKTISFLNLLGRLGYYKLKGEDHLRNSPLPHMIVRPAGLSNEEGGKKQLSFGQGDQMSFRWVTRADVAMCCVESADYLKKSSERLCVQMTFEMGESTPNDPSSFVKSLPKNHEDWSIIFQKILS